MSSTSVVKNPYAKRKAPSGGGGGGSSSGASRIPPTSSSSGAAPQLINSYSSSTLLRGGPSSSDGTLPEFPNHRTTNYTTFSQSFADVEIPPSVAQQPPAVQQAPTKEPSDQQQQQLEGLSTSNNLADNSTWSDRDHHLFLDAQPHVLYVSHRQKGNEILQHVRNVPWTYARMVPDYIWGTTRCALFLSLKYHALHPSYLNSRLNELGHDFALRILLVLVDVQDNANLLLQLNVLAVRNSLTMLLAWSPAEAARYLETFKALEGKDASLIKQQLKSTFPEQVVDVLIESGSGVNRTDAGQLLSQFGTMRSLVVANTDELALVPGMGPIKVQRLHDAFHKPFSKKASAARKRRIAKAADEAISNANAIADQANDATPLASNDMAREGTDKLENDTSNSRSSSPQNLPPTKLDVEDIDEINNLL